MCTRGHVIQPASLWFQPPSPFLESNMRRLSRCWFNQGSVPVCLVWGAHPGRNVLKILFAGICTSERRDHRYARPPTPTIQYNKKDLHTVWADGKVILNGECVLLKQACVLLKGKDFKAVKSSSQSLIMGKGTSACTSCGFTLGQCFEWRDVFAYYSWLMIYCLFCSAGRLSWTS